MCSASRWSIFDRRVKFHLAYLLLVTLNKCALNQAVHEHKVTSKSDCLALAKLPCSVEAVLFLEAKVSTLKLRNNFTFCEPVHAIKSHSRNTAVVGRKFEGCGCRYRFGNMNEMQSRNEMVAGSRVILTRLLQFQIASRPTWGELCHDRLVKIYNSEVHVTVMFGGSESSARFWKLPPKKSCICPWTSLCHGRIGVDASQSRSRSRDAPKHWFGTSFAFNQKGSAHSNCTKR